MRPMLDVLADEDLPFKVARYVRSAARAKSLVTRLRKAMEGQRAVPYKVSGTIRKVADCNTSGFLQYSRSSREPSNWNPHYSNSTVVGRAPSKQQHRTTDGWKGCCRICFAEGVKLMEATTERDRVDLRR